MTTNCGWASLQFAPFFKIHSLRNHQHISRSLFCPSTNSSRFSLLRIPRPSINFASSVLHYSTELLISLTPPSISLPMRGCTHHPPCFRTWFITPNIYYHRSPSHKEMPSKSSRSGSTIATHRAKWCTDVWCECCQLGGVVVAARNRGLIPKMFRGKFTNRVLLVRWAPELSTHRLWHFTFCHTNNCGPIINTSQQDIFSIRII